MLWSIKKREGIVEDAWVKISTLWSYIPITEFSGSA
jgi:hypothetical protein